MKKSLLIILALIMIIATFLGSCSNIPDNDTPEDTLPDGEYEFFSKLYKEATGLTVAFENGTASGDWSEAKEQLLKYYTNKFAAYDFLQNGASDSTNQTAPQDTLIFTDSEQYISRQKVSTELKQISIKIPNNKVQANYILAVLTHSTDSGVLMYSKESGAEYAPVLTVTYVGGTKVDYPVLYDTYIRATGYDSKNKNAKTAWGKENPNELWAMHTSDIENKMPYSDTEMRTYLKFDYTPTGKNISKAEIKIYAQVKNPTSDEAPGTKNLQLSVISPCYTGFDETLTWNTIAEANSFAFYSWDGFGEILWSEELYGKGYKELHTPLEFINATARLQEVSALCAAGEHKVAKKILLDFADQTYDVIKNASDGEGGFPIKRPYEPAYRSIAFPYIYRELVTNNILTPEENYQILHWYYQDIQFLYYEKTGQIYLGNNAIPNTKTNAYIDIMSHLPGFYNTFAFFPEFEESEEWRKVFEDRLVLVMGVIANPDGSYFQPSFGYPAGVLNWYGNILSYMEKLGDSSKGAELLNTNINRIVQYLADSSYPNGYLPKYGDGSSPKLSNITGSSGVIPSLAALYPDSKLAVSRTGTTAKDAMLFMNAKGGGMHSHADSLAILLYAKGKELLADQGHLSYDSKNEGYDLISRTYTHNTVEVNRKGQNNPSGSGTLVRNAIDGEAENIVQYANTASTTIRAYTTSNADAVHYRNVTWLKEYDLLLVNDYIKSETGKDVSCTQNWHTLPDALPKVADNGILGYTNFKSGANLIIAQTTPNGDGGNTIAGAIKTSPDANSSSKTSEYFEFSQSGKNVTFNTAIAYYSGTAFGLRNSALNTGVKDYVASAMLVERFNDNDMKNYLDSVIYYNAFEDSPSDRTVSSDTKTLFKTNAANAYFHKVEKVDALSISGGTTLTVYDSDENTVIAHLTASAMVTDLSVKLDAATGIITVSTTDAEVINGTVTFTVEFSQYDSIFGITLNGKALTEGADIITNGNSATVKVQQ